MIKEIINTKDIKESITLEAIDTPYMNIDIYTIVNGVEYYIGCMNDLKRLTLDKEGTLMVSRDTLTYAGAIHNINKIVHKRFSKEITTYQIYTNMD